MFQRAELLTSIARIATSVAPDRIARIAIDGVDGSGKTIFANELAEVVVRLGRPVIRASVDGFHNPRIIRYARGRQSPLGFFEDSYNYALLKQYLLDPLRPGGHRRYCAAVFDHVTDLPLPLMEQEAHPVSMLLFDGIFLHRPELRSYWDASIFLRVNFEASIARCAARDGLSPDPSAASNQRYVEGQRIYLDRCSPEAHATIVIDNNDLSAPFVVAVP